jgi:hypothetical protein
VDYLDCFNVEPINWLYPDRAPTGAWREETWALELFFKGPGGERAGTLFSAVKHDPEATRQLDRIALLSLRKAVLDQLLAKHPSFVFSINVTALTLADDKWFRHYTQGFVDALRTREAVDRVVLEIQEHPAQLLRELGIGEDVLSCRLELLRHAPLAMALDDAYSEGYVFQAANDSLGGRIVWQKMDWHYFQKKVVGARGTVRDGIRRCLRQGTPILVVEGVEDDTLKGFLCEDVLAGGTIAPRVAIQSWTTRMVLPAAGRSGRKKATPARDASRESRAGGSPDPAPEGSATGPSVVFRKTVSRSVLNFGPQQGIVSTGDGAVLMQEMDPAASGQGTRRKGAAAVQPGKQRDEVMSAQSAAGDSVARIAPAAVEGAGAENVRQHPILKALQENNSPIALHSGDAAPGSSPDKAALRRALNRRDHGEILEIGAEIEAGLAPAMSKAAAIAALLNWASTPERREALRRAIGGPA